MDNEQLVKYLESLVVSAGKSIDGAIRHTILESGVKALIVAFKEKDDE